MDETQLTERLTALRIERPVTPRKAAAPRATTVLTRTAQPRVWVVSVLLLAVAGLGLGVRYLGPDAPRSSAAVPATGVHVPAARPSSRGVWIATARVEATTLARLSARVTAPIAMVHVREGQHVTAGDPLLELDRSWAEQDAVVARAETRASRAKLAVRRAEQAEVERRLDQEARLVRSAVLSLETLRQRRAEHTQLLENIRAETLEVRASEARATRVALERDAYALRAPFDGVVAAPPAGVGQLVGPMQEPVIELYDAHSLRVVADVAETKLALVRVGQRCEVRLDAAPEQPQQAEVERLAPRLDRARATLAVYLRVANSPVELRPAMAARVECNEGASE